MDDKDKWKEALRFFESRFGPDLDLDAILFLIGIQELGQGRKKLTKDEKVDVMHVAVCTLLEPFGYYEFQGRDDAGWPHFKRNSKLPHLKPGEQHRLMKEAVVTYVEEQLNSPLNINHDDTAHPSES